MLLGECLPWNLMSSPAPYLAPWGRGAPGGRIQGGEGTHLDTSRWGWSHASGERGYARSVFTLWGRWDRNKEVDPVPAVCQGQEEVKEQD